MEQLEPIIPTTKRERELHDRAVRDYAALQAVGLDTGRTFYAPGTEAVVALKLGTIAQARTEYSELPIASEALGQLADAVQQEDRRDVPARFGGYAHKEPDALFLQPAFFGGLELARSGATGEKIAPTERSYQQLLAKRPSGHAAPGPDIAAWLADVPTGDVVVRTRKLPAARDIVPYRGAREAYAVVSPSYVPYDLDAAANDLAKVCPSDSRARIRYDGARATIDVVLQNPYRMADGSGDAAAVGETHRVVLRVKTADDGSAGYHVSLLAERVRCINLTLLHAKRSLFHGTHRQASLRDLADDALQAIEPTIEAFAATWREAWVEYYADRFTGAVSGEEALRRIVASGKYRIPGLGEDGTLEACLQALVEEPGDSKAHVHNAMTRAAHASPVTWATRWADDTAEEQASALLYQKVRWLVEPEVLA